MLANNILKTKPKYLGSFNDLDSLPFSHIDEVAFVGRSNVGKSSLINAIVKQKIAFASQTPGRTQSLNFFNWDDYVMFVDLPGYGYAKTSKDLATSWQNLMKDYLRGRTQLKRVFLLIDSKTGIKESDNEMMKMLDECGILYQVVLTKLDKIKDKEVEKLKASFKDLFLKHGAMFQEVLFTSSEKNTGIDQLRNIILNLE